MNLMSPSRELIAPVLETFGRSRAAPHLRREQILVLLREHGNEIRKLFPVTSLTLFGSIARDEAGPDSDIDLLVTFEGPTTSEIYFGLKFFLEDLLHRPVDLATEAALRVRLRAHIEAEMVEVRLDGVRDSRPPSAARLTLASPPQAPAPAVPPTPAEPGGRSG